MGLPELILRFLYVGLFTVGGGLASIPLLIENLVDTGLISESLFYNMLAVAQSTPGPIGVNLATYIGFSQHGVGGGIITTLSLIIPCFIISCLVSRVFQKFSETKVVKSAFYGIRAVVAGLIATAAFGVYKVTLLGWKEFCSSGSLLDLFHWKAILIFAVLFILLRRYKKHPILYIALGGLAGFFLL